MSPLGLHSHTFINVHVRGLQAQDVASGALTPRETAKLEREQAHFEKADAHAEADGKVTPAERCGHRQVS